MVERLLDRLLTGGALRCLEGVPGTREDHFSLETDLACPAHPHSTAHPFHSPICLAGLT